MPSPTDKKNAQVNIKNMSKPMKEDDKPIENTSKVELPDWVVEEMSSNPKSREVKELDINNTQSNIKSDYVDWNAVPDDEVEEVKQKIANNESTPKELVFKSNSKSQDEINNVAKNAVTKIENQEPFDDKDISDAKEKYNDLQTKFTDERMKALAETNPNQWSTIATIASALITAATGGAIPFIPFNSITGNDQKIAYYNKLKATYADEMQNIDVDYKKLDAERAKEATSTDTTIANAKKMAEEKGARDTSSEAYLSNFENNIAKDFGSFNTKQQKMLMTVAQDLQNMSEAEALRYLQHFASTEGAQDNATLKTIAKWESAINSGLTPNQVGARTVSAWTNAIVEPSAKIGDVVGNIIHGGKK